ncbi:MAG TPA: Ppx/GppA phosphatase family protein [Bryobacteraceae bacterium]|nr:Ppx/GppA phosphatase family protein [Bryobacteraceae bacterium]HUO32235.1 Ppx/GppA phosphatase family protein [Bryobacteraceae bacterium]
MPRYAAVDIGSNSIRMQAAETGPGVATIILASERQVTRLGEGVFRDGRITANAMEFVCQNLARMAGIYQKLDVIGVRAVATSAVRDASNAQEFLERAAQALGTPVEIISGQEEARLIHLGVQSRWPQAGKRVLILDVGGGSAETILADQGVLAEAFSKPLGAVRLTEVFLKTDPPTPLELHRMNEYIEEKLAAPVRRIGAGPFDRAIATSATAAAIVCAVNRVARSRREEADRLKASVAQIRRFFRDVRTLNLAARRKVQGIGPNRAELIVAGAAVFLRALEMFQQPALHYSAAGVRDGIIADLASRNVGRERSMLNRDQRRTVEQMARRYGVQLGHARKVAEIARGLFESLQPLHRLPPELGKLLEAAAYLHDIGHFVSDTSHHKHSYYLVANSDLAGFTDNERNLVALLCRYHRKSMPMLRHSPFQAVDSDSRRAITLLVPLLRIADSLDRSHEQRIHDMQVHLRNGTVTIALDAEPDPDIEMWAVERVADSFRETYQSALQLTRIKA